MFVDPPKAALEGSRSPGPPTLPEGEKNQTNSSVHVHFFEWLVFFISCGAVYALLPLWVPLILAVWTAVATAPIVNRVSSPHRRRRAAAITTAIAVAITVPLVLLGMVLTKSLVALIDQVTTAEDKGAALHSILAAGTGLPAHLDVQGVVTAIKAYSQGALNAFNVVVGTVVEGVIGVTIFVLATYTFLISGKGLYIWALDRLPFPRGSVHRLANAFVETGRGLFFGVGITALMQGALAGMGYYALLIPQSAVLALLTTVAAVMSPFGAALVWIPVVGGLLVAGEPLESLVLLIVGVLISILDNLMRPILTRKGDLQLPTFVVFVAIMGGLASFGGWGVILGPLIVRLAVEGLEIVSAERVQH